VGKTLYDEGRVEALDRQNKCLKKELSRKDNAFMKCADLCSFLSTVLSNEYITLRRTNGFKEPLGLTLIRDEHEHMMDQFKWSDASEDLKYHPMDKVDMEELKKKQEIRKIITEKHSVPITPSKSGNVSKKNNGFDIKLMSTGYCPKCKSGIAMDGGSMEDGSGSEEDRGMIDNNYDDQESIDPALLVDKLSPLEKAILDKIREVNVSKIIEEHPRDVEIIRSKQ
jgi:hypothetical protein